MVRGVCCQSAEEWIQQGKDELEKYLELKQNTNIAKNVIVFLGDGMGIPTVTSARIYKGQLAGQTGEEYVLGFEGLPRAALIKTYNTDYQVPDSAGTATAMLSGVKTKRGLIGVDSSVQRANCSSVTEKAKLESVFDLAVKEGKSAGIISTKSITNASPASVYAHSPERYWESVGVDGCKDIAAQFLENSLDFQVVLAGGRKTMMPISETDPEDPELRGERLDGRNLIDEWVDSIPDGINAQYVWNQEQFDNVDTDNIEYLLGLFGHDEMKFECKRHNDTAGEPSIVEMVEKAITILQKNDRGYFLFVEGGLIDTAHHGNWAYGAITDTVAFDDAVEKALDMVSTEDTLVIVTADHGHVNTVNGYPYRGNPILGVTSDVLEAYDELPYTTITYANGPSGVAVAASYRINGTRPDIRLQDTESPNYIQQSLVPTDSESHGGEDVSLHADGPYSHLFQGVHEQTYIAHVIKYAARLGEYAEDHNNGVSLLHVRLHVCLCLAIVFCFQFMYFPGLYNL
ncbi:alkaline phosphatase-like [Saccoglossus kowalevskii]